MRLIDADLLIQDAIQEYARSKQYRDAFTRMVNKAPTIEPKRGEWLWSPRDADGTVSGCCSNCSFSHLFVGGHTAQYNFCPNCGARMRPKLQGKHFDSIIIDESWKGADDER